MKVCLNVMATESIFGGDIHAVFDLAERADRMGVDQISTSEHLGFNQAAHIERRVTSHFPYPIEQHWFEPISMLTAIAMRTKRARLSTFVMIAPLRGPALLAKQVATLDVISGGRATVGLGVGWQKAEYDACGVAYEGRFGYLVEIVAACRALWAGVGASFTGKRVRFEDFHALPLPVQRERVPVYLGLPPTPANCARMAEVSDGWCVRPLPLEEFAAGVAELRRAWRAAGRDAADIHIETPIGPVRRADGSVDYGATRESLRPWAKAGVTMFQALPPSFCSGPQDVDAFLEFLIGLKSLQP